MRNDVTIILIRKPRNKENGFRNARSFTASRNVYFGNKDRKDAPLIKAGEINPEPHPVPHPLQ